MLLEAISTFNILNIGLDAFANFEKCIPILVQYHVCYEILTNV